VCCVACQGGGTASVCTLYVVYVVGTVRCTVRCVCVVQWEIVPGLDSGIVLL
jgi:hypothetical protein